MEIKKDPQVDLEPRKTTYALTGLVAILAILFIAFEWTNATYRKVNLGAGDAVIEEEEEIVMTVQNTPPPPPPPPPMPDVIEQLTVVEDDVEVAEIEMQSAEDDANTVVEIVQAVEEAPVEEDDDIIMSVADTGAGMLPIAAEKLRDDLDNGDPLASGSYGLINVNTRQNIFPH